MFQFSRSSVFENIVLFKFMAIIFTVYFNFNFNSTLTRMFIAVLFTLCLCCMTPDMYLMILNLPHVNYVFFVVVVVVVFFVISFHRRNLVILWA